MEPKLTPGGFCNLFTQKGLIRCPVGALAHGVFDFGVMGARVVSAAIPGSQRALTDEGWLAGPEMRD